MTDGTNNKSDAQKLVDQRLSVYGDRVENMVRVAKMWEGLFNFPVQPWQVPLAFAMYKMYRAGITPDYSDTIDDVDGYLLMFREVIGEDMVQARTVEEYLDIKAARDRTTKEAEFDRLINPEAAAEKEAMVNFDQRWRSMDPGLISELENYQPTAKQLEQFLDWLEQKGYAIYDQMADHVFSPGREGKPFGTWFKIEQR